MVVEQVAGSQQAVHGLRVDVHECLAETRETRSTLERRIGSVEHELGRLTRVLHELLCTMLQPGELHMTFFVSSGCAPAHTFTVLP